ncbi:MAG: PEP-CTERM sorting domain-containing protein, partial [Burkholderiales bacterium]|nr:PEP-CTERM sorting domain-containing protein [Burkholderiales bacterium]
DLLAMTMSLSGIPTAPSTTSFTKADLSSFEWILQVDGAGVISDLNFFMRGGAANADGYSIEGISPFNSVFCHGTAVVNACAGAAAPTEIDRLVIHVTDIGTVPEPLSLALVGLGLAGVGVSRRKKA